ncbi:MAG: glutathione S-transferase family protein [Alphaproteobacteria bacterium]|nr:glutathione S-transferase family protein [Alphaproteobacteria bacterium]
MPVLYDDPLSGNGYKVRLLMHLLGMPFRYVPVSVVARETRRPAFLAKNPNGRIPALELDDGQVLSESNAIMVYLAEGTPLWPADRLERAQTLQWMFFEQYDHEPRVAVARFLTLHPETNDPRLPELPALREKARQPLQVMEQHLARAPYFVGERFGLADIALYAYTHVAGEGGISLDAFPAIRAWVHRVAGQPRHQPITWVPAS